jgi:hypothetical protein
MRAARAKYSPTADPRVPVWSHSEGLTRALALQALIGEDRDAFYSCRTGRFSPIRIYYKDHGSGPPVALAHGYALNAALVGKQKIGGQCVEFVSHARSA